MSHTKRSHYVPQVYLRAWANDRNQVAVRRRGSVDCFKSNIKDVAVQSHLYGKGLNGQIREQMFGNLEGEWPAMRAALLADGGLIQAPMRDKVALFMALQFIRTHKQGAQMKFFRALSEWTTVRPISKEDVRRFLQERILHFAPSDQEVEGAWSLAYIALKDGPPPSIDEEMGIHFDLAVKKVAPLLTEYSWAVEHCPKPILMTSDRPFMTWRPPSYRDAYEGVGIGNSDELRFPLTPSDLLVIQRGNYQIGVHTVQPKRFMRVNAAVASQCQDQIIGTVKNSADMRALRLADWRPMIRFNTGPGWLESSDGSRERMDDVIHTWSPTHV